MSVKEIYLNVFQQSQYEIGRLWMMNQVSVAQEHYCTAATQLIMSQLYPHIFGTEKIGRWLVATCVGGELHEIGVRMVADFFELEGWDTYYMGANAPAKTIVQAVEERKPDILGISATMLFHVGVVKMLIEQVRELVDDLLDVATIESGKLELELWPADVAALVRNDVALSRILAEKKGIELRFESQGEIPELFIDSSKIEQVILNLLSNALKFSPTGSRIIVRLNKSDEDVVVSVTDTGPGIPADELEKMFELFQKTTVKSSEGEKISGLGLAIAKKIVDAHGGKLWAESVVGKGSTFHVALPYM